MPGKVVARLFAGLCLDDTWFPKPESHRKLIARQRGKICRNGTHHETQKDELYPTVRESASDSNVLAFRKISVNFSALEGVSALRIFLALGEKISKFASAAFRTRR